MIYLVLAILFFIGVPLYLGYLRPIIIYFKIGSFENYKPLCGNLMNKEDEYSLFQIAGFKNIGSDVMDIIKSVSQCCTKNDLKWLQDWSNYLHKALKDSGVENKNDLFLSYPLEEVNFIEAISKIKKCRKYLPDKCNKYGLYTCGEAAVLSVIVDVRIMCIENRPTECEPGELDYYIEAAKILKNH